MTDKYNGIQFHKLEEYIKHKYQVYVCVFLGIATAQTESVIQSWDGGGDK